MHALATVATERRDGKGATGLVWANGGYTTKHAFGVYSTQPPKEARALLGEMAHILNTIFSALLQRESPYASVLGALIELAGEKAQAVTIAPDEPLDASWDEPLAFDGCSTSGQARPGTPQPIHLVRKSSATEGVQP